MESKKFSRGKFYAYVAGMRDSLIILMDYMHPWPRVSVFIQKYRTSISRTIIHKNKLNIAIILSFDRSQTLGEISQSVVNGNDDGN